MNPHTRDEDFNGAMVAILIAVVVIVVCLA